MFSLVAALFVLCTISITCRPFSCTPAIVTHDCTSVTCISPALFNVDRRLLFNTGGSYVFKPRQHHSPYPALVALLLLLGGVETNPGLAAKLNHKSTSYTTISSGYLNCRSATSKIAVIHDLINESKFDVLFLCETWFTFDTPTSVLRDVAPPGYSTRCRDLTHTLLFLGAIRNAYQRSASGGGGRSL